VTSLHVGLSLHQPQCQLSTSSTICLPSGVQCCPATTGSNASAVRPPVTNPVDVAPATGLVKPRGSRSGLVVEDLPAVAAVATPALRVLLYCASPLRAPADAAARPPATPPPAATAAVLEASMGLTAPVMESPSSTTSSSPSSACLPVEDTLPADDSTEGPAMDQRVPVPPPPPPVVARLPVSARLRPPPLSPRRCHARGRRECLVGCGPPSPCLWAGAGSPSVFGFPAARRACARHSCDCFPSHPPCVTAVQDSRRKRGFKVQALELKWGGGGGSRTGARAGGCHARWLAVGHTGAQRGSSWSDRRDAPRLRNERRLRHDRGQRAPVPLIMTSVGTGEKRIDPSGLRWLLSLVPGRDAKNRGTDHNVML